MKIVAKQAGYHVFTLNASDTRSKLKIEAMLNDLSKCNSIAAMMGTDNPTDTSMVEKEWSMTGKTLILMDEVDGVSSSDRGGLPALIKIIKVTKMPIVCIANDVGNRKIQTLKNHSLDLRFQKPSAKDLCRRINDIMVRENIQIEHSSIEMLGEQNGNDVR